MPSSKINYNEEWYNGFASSYRGYRNGVVTGVRVRIPYVLQSLIYAFLYYDKKPYRDRVSFVLKQMFYHARNLGCYVAIYKTVCLLLRKCGIQNGLESIIAGFIGGSTAFGGSSGVSGAVNYQLVLYLFARGMEGALGIAAEKNVLPPSLDIRTPNGFRIFAGISLALMLYITEYWPNVLKPGFMSTMTYLYHDSNSGLLGTSKRFTLIVFIVSASLLFGDAIGIQRIQSSNLMKEMENVIQWLGNLLLGKTK
jgi:peroxisomal membrane protein 4